jgi:hypothetical protein
LGGFGKNLKNVTKRLTDVPRRNLAISEYITPFGYEGKTKEIGKFLSNYVLKGKDVPNVG